MLLTTERRALGPFETITTVVAVCLSSALYLRDGHPYLARGVVGDITGLAVLTAVVAGRHRRVRHEALVCLVAIGLVLAVNPEWPLRGSSTFWWLVVATGLATYLAVRNRVLFRTDG
jgi:hypothetical protein